MKNRHTQYAGAKAFYRAMSGLRVEGLLQEGDEASNEGRVTEDLEQNCKKCSDSHFSPFVSDRFY